MAIGPRVEGERPASLDATSSAAVGRLIGDLETMRRHVDALGRAKRENFSLEVREGGQQCRGPWSRL